MKKVILIDGNNLVFRAYFATSYSGNVMRNSEGFPTNALYGFVNMINKIIDEEKPTHIMVAFDIGKNFRKEKYDFYKDGRNATPEELKMQMPYARKILDAMGIKYLELEPYEADDIIGTYVKKAEEDKDYATTIISSDKDLLQLINFETEVKLLKKDSFVRLDEKTFEEEYGIKPIKMIDLKALMGDASDNIPGVKGIGEKTALKLLHDYESLEGVYENIENIKGATKEKLIKDKDNAFMSKEIATIYKDVPLEETFEDLIYKGHNELLIPLYKELGFNSFIRKLENEKPIDEIKFIEVENVNDMELSNDVSMYLELDNENYHEASVIGIGISDKDNNYFVKGQLLSEVVTYVDNRNICTYDVKKNVKYSHNIYNDDVMVSSFLLGKIVKDDISFLMDDVNYDYSKLKKSKYDIELIKKSVVTKSRYIFENNFKNIVDLKNHDLYDLYEKIELPLINILSNMEKEGIVCKKEILENLKEIIEKDIKTISEEIHDLAGEEFNISSPKQLGEILFEKMNIAKGSKNKTGYKTDASVLEKLIDKNPIIEKILKYRNLSKIYSTYIEGLEIYIREDSKIHPIYKQTLARTGRLTCTEPNLQNIPVREELGKQIRKAFVPNNDLFLSADYSQIELRILAHISEDETLINAFNNGLDIHRKVAADIYGIDESEVTKIQRKTAKAVIFGIVYGISGFGLGENLSITKKEADEFIKKYYELYPKVKIYMDNIIKEVKETNIVKTLYKRRRFIEEISSSNFMVRQMGERMALNTPIQGTSADIIKVAMIRIFKKIKDLNLKSKLILQVHDELIFDVDNAELDIMKEIVKEEMENVIVLKVPLEVGISVASNWYEV